MTAERGKAASQRQLRVGEELRHALARILAREAFRDPLLAEQNLTVTEVRVSPDLKNATAFVLPLGGVDKAAVVTALNRAAGFLRGKIGREVNLRYTPKIGFKPDDSFDEADRIDQILRRPKVRFDLDPVDDTASDQNS
ncbi:MAG: 30S ribosome-binding factor RbfA [Pseudomonadota bacterium]